MVVVIYPNLWDVMQSSISLLCTHWFMLSHPAVTMHVNTGVQPASVSDCSLDDVIVRRTVWEYSGKREVVLRNCTLIQTPAIYLWCALPRTINTCLVMYRTSVKWDNQQMKGSSNNIASHVLVPCLLLSLEGVFLLRPNMLI